MNIEDYIKTHKNICIKDTIYGHEKYDYDDVILQIYNVDKKQRLNSLYLIWNGGPNSGNHNPGQGRGVGKPNNGTISQYLDEIVFREKGAHSISNYIDANRQITPERQKLHEEIVNEILDSGKEVENPIVMFTGGGMSAGKSTILDKDSMIIDPDAIKSKIPEFNEAVEKGDVNAGGYAHEESSAIGKLAQNKALTSGIKKNITIDGSLSGPTDKIVRKINAVKEFGREVEVRLVSTAVNTALERSFYRYQDNGRFPSLKTTIDSHKGVSNNFDSIVKVADRVKLYNNDGSKPVLIAEASKGKLKILNKTKYEAFKNISNESTQRLIDDFNSNIENYESKYQKNNPGKKLRKRP